MEVQELQNKVKELENRLERLEKIENRRKTLTLIKILIKVIIIIALLIGLWIGYNYVNNTYIKPYKETMDEIKETYDNIKSPNLSFDIDSILGKTKDKNKE